MMMTHHPSPETLARFAAGTLPAGQALVVSAHVSGCPACRAQRLQFEAIGGVLLQDADPVPLAVEAVDMALARTDLPLPAPAPFPVRRFLADLPSSITVPQSLRDRDVGRWRWLVPGIHWSRVAVPEDSATSVFLIRVAPNKKLPEHGHTGLEFTHVLSGSFSDADGRYLPGDTLEADPDIDHQPVADPDGECICLVAVEGVIKMHGLVGRVLRPFIGA